MVDLRVGVDPDEPRLGRSPHRRFHGHERGDLRDRALGYARALEVLDGPVRTPRDDLRRIDLAHGGQGHELLERRAVEVELGVGLRGRRGTRLLHFDERRELGELGVRDAQALQVVHRLERPRREDLLGRRRSDARQLLELFGGRLVQVDLRRRCLHGLGRTGRRLHFDERRELHEVGLGHAHVLQVVHRLERPRREDLLRGGGSDPRELLELLGGRRVQVDLGGRLFRGLLRRTVRGKARDRQPDQHPERRDRSTHGPSVTLPAHARPASDPGRESENAAGPRPVRPTIIAASGRVSPRTRNGRRVEDT